MIKLKHVLIILIIVVNLNSMMLFYSVFYSTSGTTFERLTGKALSNSGGVDICVDRWINISWLPDQTAYIGVVYSADINITDEFSHPFLNFTDNSTIININWSNGYFAFTPLFAQQGNYTINVTVTNDACNELDDSMVFNLTIKISNHAPVLNITPNFTYLVEDVLFEYNISANVTEPDGDTVYFFDNTSLFNIDSFTGIIAYLPTNDDVGNHSVKITASDLVYIDEQDVFISIRNVNDPPVISPPIGAHTAYINQTYKLNITALDVDPADYLIFSSNTSWFLNQSSSYPVNNSYGNLTLSFLFTNITHWNGTYSVNVSVNDTNGTMDSEVISFTITRFNNPPNITWWDPTSFEFDLTTGNNQTFNITKEDPDGTIPSVSWYINDVLMVTTDYFEWDTTNNATGDYNITVRITDGLVDDAESWIISLVAPPSPPQLVEGTSVGGGGFGGDVIRAICEELWACEDWSVCSEAELQTRECEDLRKCGTTMNKPGEIRDCTYVETPSCFDGVQNQNEVLVDCGGICKSCPSCRDGVQNQGETQVDCGGPCRACQEVREPVKPNKIEFNAKELVGNLNLYWPVWFLLTLLLLSLIRFGLYAKKVSFGQALGLFAVPIRVLRVKMLVAKTKSLMAKKDIADAKAAYSKANEIYKKLPKSVAKKIKI